MAAASHVRITHKAWSKIQANRTNKASAVVLDGESLDVASLVAVAKYGSTPELDRSPKTLERIDKSVEMLRRHLERGDLVYGVNTGYGGSADTRTKDLKSLQQALVQHQQSGILTSIDTGVPDLGVGEEKVAPTHLEDFGSLAMPTAWVKGLMLQRVNSIIRGHSGVSLPIIESIVNLLQKDITPVVPLRGSISASGDLSSLSYIAGAISGNPDIFCRVGNPPVIMNARAALEAHELQPVVLAAKEGLGLLNGTAASVSAASLAVQESNQLALLSQVLTATCVEALCGSAECFNPFIANIRPHRGQLEAASNIFNFLQGSRLASGLEGEKSEDHIMGLAQDRYPLRTSSQWIGPQLEDLLLATEQVSVELNSTTDNPLIDVDADLIHHGGNFQAASLSSAMEKTRLSLQMLGKLMFSQGTELINCALNKGLPPNLAADDPSLSFTCKGIDINIAAYMSELAYLANPVSSHVQSAELHNQAVNSLALISARYTLQAVEVLSQMCAAYIFALCQALDLRVLQYRFLQKAHTDICALITSAAASLASDKASSPGFNAAALIATIWPTIKETWSASTNMDLLPRSARAARAGALAFLYETSAPRAAVETLEAQIASTLHALYTGQRDRMFEDHVRITPEYLGVASKRIYLCVRGTLGVAMSRGLVDYPGYRGGAEVGGAEATGGEDNRRTIGTFVSRIYEALRGGELYRAVMEAVEEAGA
ncbi:L-Aspartase-like protein [Phyllosticta paracitricarpa]|uniref:Phenylalanine ammonia-lyase n=1 Tax=Phyllosticta paracitricarpa TaxID=2016321 RepID=A0ABR1NF02_9PEZI